MTEELNLLEYIWLLLLFGCFMIVYTIIYIPLFVAEWVNWKLHELHGENK